ncbi:MAG: DUF2066 domain-containing protein [Pseudomonadota bacterium]
MDVTAASAAAARDAAIVVGQRIAFEKLVGELADSEAVARLPRLSDAEIADLVSDFEVESERASAVRYIGKLSFRFKGGPVRAFLEQNGVRYAVLPSTPILVVPVLQIDDQTLLWDAQNAWLRAWAAQPSGGTLVPLEIPSGDELDASIIDAAGAVAGEAAKLAALDRRYGATEALVVVAKLGADAASDARNLDIDAKRYGPAGLVASFTDRVSLGGAGLDELYAAAVDRVQSLLQDQIKQQNLVASGAEQRLSVTVPIDGFPAWLEIRRRLAGIPTLKRAEIRTLSTAAAELDLVYVGDETQLVSALGERRLALASDGGRRVLLATESGAAPAGTPAAGAPSTAP